MKKFFFRSLLMVALMLGVSLTAFADTIRLKNGSVIRGQIVSFKNEQFTIVVGGGTRGRTTRITIYMEDVESIEFDSAGNTSNSTGPNDDTTNNNQPPYQPPVNNQPTNNQPAYPPPTLRARVAPPRGSRRDDAARRARRTGSSPSGTPSRTPVPAPLRAGRSRACT